METLAVKYRPKTFEDMVEQSVVKDILIPSEEEKIRMYPFDFEEFLWAMDNMQKI